MRVRYCRPTEAALLCSPPPRAALRRPAPHPQHGRRTGPGQLREDMFHFVYCSNTTSGEHKCNVMPSGNRLGMEKISATRNTRNETVVFLVMNAAAGPRPGLVWSHCGDWDRIAHPKKWALLRNPVHFLTSAVGPARRRAGPSANRVQECMY